MKKISLFVTLLLVGLILLSGCSEETEPTGDSDLLQVYTTVYPLKFFTERIGGEYVEVDTIYPPGADEHTFEPSQKDMMKLADSDLFIFVGLGLEGFVDKSRGTLQNEEVTLLSAGEHIHFEEEHEEEEHKEEEHGEHDDHAHGDIDPHVWIDPIYAKELALAIKKQLTIELPDQKETFEENYLKLAADLEELDSQFKELVMDTTHKEIIVAHSAYGYWEKRYGIEQVSISGLATSDEPSQKELQKLIELGKAKELKYVLYEQNFQSRLAETVQNELGANSLTLHNLSVLTKDDIQNNETYFTIMEKNLDSLRTALSE